MRKIWIDCKENIPCDPCQHSCPVGAIRIGENITDLPQTEPEKCIGCGKCVAACPGQACFLVDDEFAPGRASVDFPFEYLPRPREGMTVIARNNEGEDVCEGIVEKVIDIKSNQQTAVVRISVPVEHAYEIRGMKRLPREGGTIHG